MRQWRDVGVENNRVDKKDVDVGNASQLRQWKDDDVRQMRYPNDDKSEWIGLLWRAGRPMKQRENKRRKQNRGGRKNLGEWGKMGTEGMMLQNEC